MHPDLAKHYNDVKVAQVWEVFSGEGRFYD